MKLLNFSTPKLVIVFSISCALFFSTLLAPPVQAQSKLPPPTSHVGDTAGAIAEPAKQQLENILANLEQRSGINFTVLTVLTTGGMDIFDYSAEVARQWNIGAKTSTGKSLLLVVSVDEKTFATQFSKRVQRDLPEGALADMNEQMRAPVRSGHTAEALLIGVQKLVSALAGRIGFNTDGMDQAPTAPLATASQPTNTSVAPADSPTPTPVEESKAVESATTKKPNDEGTSNSKSASQIVDLRSQILDPSRKKKESASEFMKPAGSNANSGPNAKKKNTPEDDAAEAEQVEVMLTLALAPRIDSLKNFLITHPESKSKTRATEMLITTRAMLGDEKLKRGDIAGGTEQMFLALADFVPEMSDKLFSGVIGQIPLNLYVRGETTAALKAAEQIEAKVADNPKRLLALSGFYLEIERGHEAARIAGLAVKLAPDLAEPHNALAMAMHISLRLDEAASEYTRALQLDPKTPGARRGLADLDRASGKFEDALALYREQLQAEPKDKAARVGLVLSLLELGKIDEGRQELNAALKDDPRNLSLLTGASYWFVAHGESSLALALGQKAVDVEPRYTWAQIAAARALVAQKQPLSAERALRYAQQYGKFPTLDYELASTLASLGLYEEAGETLLRSFTLQDGQIETQLANRYPARAASFNELLALERRASIFQPAAADTEENARILKALLALTLAISPPGADAKVDESAATTAAREFAAGNDDLRAYRHLYAASRLLKARIGFQTALELADAARDGVDRALFVPAVTVAVQADELREIRARAIASGGTPEIPEASRNVLANMLRGRIEELAGWSLFNLDKTAAAVERLRRAVGVLPEHTPLWQTANWHLGVALQQGGNNEDALTAYIKSYNSGARDPARRVVIEQLYQKINGSLNGLDDRIGPPQAIATATPTAAPANANSATDQPSTEKVNTPLPEASPTPAPTPTPEPTPAQPGPTPTPTPEATPAAQPTPSPSPSLEPTPTPTPTPEATPAPQPTPEATATPSPSPEASPSPTPEPTPTSTPEPTPVPTPNETASPAPSPTPSSETRPRRVKPPR